MAGEKAVPPFDIDDNDAVPTVILAPASLFDIQMYSNLKRYLFDIRFLWFFFLWVVFVDIVL